MTVSSSKNHFLVVDGVKMRSKKSAGTPKRKNDKAIASDSIPKPCDSFALGNPHCFDIRRYTRESTEKITTKIDFNRFLKTMDSSRSTPCLDMVRSYLREGHEVIMTHGGLHPRNIMVSRGDEDKSIKIEAIID